MRSNQGDRRNWKMELEDRSPRATRSWRASSPRHSHSIAILSHIQYHPRGVMIAAVAWVFGASIDPGFSEVVPTLMTMGPPTPCLEAATMPKPKKDGEITSFLRRRSASHPSPAFHTWPNTGLRPLRLGFPRPSSWLAKRGARVSDSSVRKLCDSSLKQMVCRLHVPHAFIAPVPRPPFPYRSRHYLTRLSAAAICSAPTPRLVGDVTSPF